MEATFSIAQDYSKTVVTHSLNKMFSEFIEKAVTQLYLNKNL